MGEKREGEMGKDWMADKSGLIEISTGTKARRCREEVRKMAQKSQKHCSLGVSSE